MCNGHVRQPGLCLHQCEGPTTKKWPLQHRRWLQAHTMHDDLHSAGTCTHLLRPHKLRHPAAPGRRNRHRCAAGATTIAHLMLLHGAVRAAAAAGGCKQAEVLLPLLPRRGCGVAAAVGLPRQVVRQVQAGGGCTVRGCAPRAARQHLRAHGSMHHHFECQFPTTRSVRAAQDIFYNTMHHFGAVHVQKDAIPSTNTVHCVLACLGVLRD